MRTSKLELRVVSLSAESQICLDLIQISPNLKIGGKRRTAVGEYFKVWLVTEEEDESEPVF